MEETMNEAVVVDSVGHAPIPANAISFLKRLKVSIPAFYKLIENGKRSIEGDGIGVAKVGLKFVQDVEEPGIEYLKIIYILRLPFEKILEYQARFYQSTLEGVVSEFMQSSGGNSGTRLARFMKHFNISFDDALS
jgi:hypothetical protein